MIKIIAPNSYDFGDPVARLIKVSSQGLVGADRQAFVKRASVDFMSRIDGLDTKPGDVLIHLLAISATEATGANRNGDGFKRACCRDYHDTFRKYAHWYRNHANKDPKKGFGHVKLSAFNDPMSRIELVVALNGSKEAAERNGGQFADLELDDLHSGRDLGVSMGCRIARDFCSYCKHASPSPEEYCDSPENGGFCKAGGLKNNMGAIVDIDGGLHQLHADNPDPLFYDISRVFRPADRTAYVLGLIDKTANAHGVVSGAKLAELLNVSAPYDLLIETASEPIIQQRLKAAAVVAQIENELQQGELPFFPDRLVAAFTPAVQPLLVPPDYCIEKQAQFLKACADEQILLPLNSFLRIFGRIGLDKISHVTDCVRQFLPTAHNRLLARSDSERAISANPYLPDKTATPEFVRWAQKNAGAYSLATRHIQKRAAVSTIRECPATVRRTVSFDKTAAAEAPAAKIAEEYALYQLGFLCSNPQFEQELPLTAPLVLLHNCFN